MQPKGTRSAPSILPLTAPLCSLRNGDPNFHTNSVSETLRGSGELNLILLASSPGKMGEVERWRGRGWGWGGREKGQGYLTAQVLTAPAHAHLPGARFLTTENSVAGATVKATPFVL